MFVNVDIMSMSVYVYIYVYKASQATSARYVRKQACSRNFIVKMLIVISSYFFFISEPLSEACKTKGGMCMPTDWICPDALLFNRATDCEQDERCCVLVK